MVSVCCVILFICSISLKVSSSALCNYRKRSNDGRIAIPIGVLASTGGDDDTTDIIPAVQLAVDIVNGNPSLLQGYFLEPCYRSSMCFAKTALSDLYDIILPALEEQTPPFPMFVIGSGCSPRAQPVATTINFINMMMVDYSASSPVLARRTLFPNFFRLEFNEKSNQLGQANFIRYLYRELSNQKVGVVLQDTPLFTDSWDAVQTQAFSTSGIETSVVRVANDLKLADFEQLLQMNFGVDPPAMFIVNAFEGQARRVFCWAVRRNLIYPKHTWLFVGWYGARWWEQNSTTSDCTVQELETFLNRTITVITEGKPDNDSAKTDVSLTRLEFREQYAEYCKNTSEVLNRDCNVDRLLTFNTYAYDSVWTMVLAMNKSLMTLSADAFNNFTFFNDSVGISVELRRQLQLTNFTGISGTVEFIENSGDRVLHPVTMSQYKFNASSGVLETKAFGLVDGTMVTDLTGSRLDLNIIFDDGIPPHRALKHINSVLYGFLTAVAIMGIILSIFFIVFTLVYRNRKIVKATSPKLNIIIVFGGILLYFSVILTHIPSNNAEYSLLACSYIPWLVNTGLVLMYIPLVLKAWRVYYIFNRSSTKASVHLPDWKLLIGLGIILGIFTLAEVILTFSPFAQKRTNEIVAVNNEIRVICTSDLHEIFPVETIIYYSIHGIILVVGLVLAFQTRNVTIKAFKESRQTSFAIFVLAMSLLVIAPVSIIVVLPVDIAAGLVSSVSIFLVVAVQCTLFLPKIYEIWIKKTDDIGSSWLTEGGYDSLYQSTLTSMQAEIDSLKEELGKDKQTQESPCHTEGTNLQSSCDADEKDSTGFNVEYTNGDVLIGEQ